MRLMFLLCLTMALFTAGAARAQDSAPAPASADSQIAAPQDAKKVEPENLSAKAVNDKAAALAKSLSSEEAKTLGHVRENFGYLRSIAIAMESVDDAVKQCGAENKDMKKDIVGRHKDWAKAIGEAHAAQEKNLAAALTEKNFKDPAPVKDYLDAIDAMAKEAEEKIEKKVITTPEACKSLQASMDDTEKTILKILEEMRWPGDAPQEESKP